MAHDFQSDLDAIAHIDAVPMILDVVCRSTGMRFAAVARVTEDRWIACSVRDEIAFGLVPGSELKVETTICNEIRVSRQAVVIFHVAEHPLYCNQHWPAMYGLQSYISMPIMHPERRILRHPVCDRSAAGQGRNTRDDRDVQAVRRADRLSSRRRKPRGWRHSEALVADLTEREGAELREQFIAVLGHDLRNPLAAIDAGTRLLSRTPLSDKAVMVLDQMQASVRRMSGLITNVLDFARGRLGGGLTLERKKVALEPTLNQVIGEFPAAPCWRSVRSTPGSPALQAVDCDPARIGQMLSNLLGNAASHGEHDSPIRVEAHSMDGVFELSVGNRGEPIPPAILAQLFRPVLSRLRSWPARVGTGTLYRRGNRPGAWRHPDRDLGRSRNPLHLPDAASLTAEGRIRMAF